MHLYSSIGPNPRVVHMFMAEKGLEIPTTTIDILKGENRQEPYVTKNPGAQSPALEMENGAVISETLAICEYLEEKHPSPAVIGSTPEERAETRMWTRRVDLGVCEPLANGFRFAEGHEMFKDRMLCRPEAADSLKAMAQDKIAWLDGQLEGKNFLAGDRFTVADIILYTFLAFGATVGQPVDRSNANIAAHYDRVEARPSAQATA